MREMPSELDRILSISLQRAGRHELVHQMPQNTTCRLSALLVTDTLIAYGINWLCAKYRYHKANSGPVSWWRSWCKGHHKIHPFHSAEHTAALGARRNCGRCQQQPAHHQQRNSIMCPLRDVCPLSHTLWHMRGSTVRELRMSHAEIFISELLLAAGSCSICHYMSCALWQ